MTCECVCLCVCELVYHSRQLVGVTFHCMCVRVALCSNDTVCIHLHGMLATAFLLCSFFLLLLSIDISILYLIGEKHMWHSECMLFPFHYCDNRVKEMANMTKTCVIRFFFSSLSYIVPLCIRCS